MLKNQLAEKDKQVKQLTKDNEKLKNNRLQEEELIATAWYSLGANLNRRATDERIATIGNSFLSQQRHLPPSSSQTTSSSSNSSMLLNSSRRAASGSNHNNNISYKNILNTPANAQSNQTASASS